MSEKTESSQADDLSKSAEILSTRIVALEILEDVLDRKQPLDIVLEKNRSFLNLSTRDKAFVRMVLATSLRHAGQIDDMIKRASERTELPNPFRLHLLLRMAAAQIAFMNVADYAVVDTAVNMAVKKGMGRQKGFVNAVCRRISENNLQWISKQDPGRLNTPEWLMKTWIADYDLRTAAEIAAANLSEAPLDISLKDLEKMEYWSETLNANILPTGSLRLSSGGSVKEFTGFEDGMWWVQDASASIPVQLFGDVSGRRVLDLCAAPGGKTAQLLSMGAKVTILDRSLNRLKRLEENLRRLRLESNVETIEVADAAVWRPKENFEFILLDAPCTATGTIRRHPDVMHLKLEADMNNLVATQKKLLHNALEILSPGGVLIYCTCSLQKAEGENQIEDLLESNKSIRRLPIAQIEVGGIEGIINEQGDVRVLPFHMAAHGGMDGFYIARLQKMPTIS